jgi:hypothetical protein
MLVWRRSVLVTPGPARMALRVVSEPGRGVDNAENVAVPVGETGRNRASRQVLWLSALATCLRKQSTEFDVGGQLFKLPPRDALTPHSHR